MRRASIAFFLGDPAFLSDPKFRALARKLPDPDDFNAAVGAFWIVVAACRRNGSHVVDVDAETGSAHITVLREVGLLATDGLPRAAFEAWAPMSPQQAAAGKARAEQARRDDRGQFVKNPASSSEPSVASALDRWTSADQPSPPLPSSYVKKNDVESLDGGGSADPEGPALTWLASHGCDIRPGNGYHRKLVTAIGRHGVVAMIRTLEDLAAAGMPDGDIKGFVFGAIDRLDAAKRPNRSSIANTADADRSRVGVERTRRRIAEVHSIAPVVGTLADHGVTKPGASS